MKRKGVDNNFFLFSKKNSPLERYLSDLFPVLPIRWGIQMQNSECRRPIHPPLNPATTTEETVVAIVSSAAARTAPSGATPGNDGTKYGTMITVESWHGRICSGCFEMIFFAGGGGIKCASFK